jgi:transposase
MLSLPAGVRVFLCIHPTDMRKSFDGLNGLVQSVFQKNVLDGHLFLFVNRRRDKLKLLYWDRDGLAVWAKRLESGTFELPAHADKASRQELDATDLSLLLNGIDLGSARRRKRFRPVE